MSPDAIENACIGAWGFGTLATWWVGNALIKANKLTFFDPSTAVFIGGLFWPLALALAPVVMVGKLAARSSDRFGDWLAARPERLASMERDMLAEAITAHAETESLIPLPDGPFRIAACRACGK